MRRAKLHISTWLMAMFLALLVSFSSVMCLKDAFALPCSQTHLLLICVGISLVCASAMIPRRTWFFFLLSLVVYLAVLIWQREAVEQSLGGLLFQITTEYALCFDGVTIRGAPGDCLAVLAALAVPLAWITAWVVCREGNALFVLLVCAPILVVCLVIVDVQPVLWLIMLTFAFLLLLLTQSVRERGSNEGSRLAWWLLLPVIILFTSITVLWPPADYVRADWSQTMQTLAEQQFKLETISQQVFSDAPRWGASEREVDLRRIGPKTMTGLSVMTCRSQSSSLYLRGVSLGVYGDNRWQAIPQADYLARNFAAQPKNMGSGAASTLELRTRLPEEVIYTTYFYDTLPETAQHVDDAYVKNPERLTEYAVTYQSFTVEQSARSLDYEDFVREYYTQVPEETRGELERILAERGWNNAKSPIELANLVRFSAEYDLNTPRIPEGEDFVLYFLEQSNRGYCVHFASATVMLLRTMGIPARYVSGYSVKGPADSWINVTVDDAHAWVEYYVDGVGWMLLDPTPVTETTEPETPDEPEALPPEEPDQSEPEVPEEPPKPTVGTAEPEQTLPKELLLLLWIPGVLALIWLRRWLTLRRRMDRCSRGEPNYRAMVMWRWFLRLSKAAGREVEEELLCLAEKARFSQHTLTEAELAQFQTAIEDRIAALKKAAFVKRLWYRYGRVLF